MGDFLSPNKKDVYERFRRRIELYRRHQNGKYSRYEPSASGLNEQNRRDTLLLRQKWLESKAKKAPRSRSRSENNSGEHRNSNTSKQKRKLEATEAHPPTVDTKVHVEESQNNPKVTKGTSQNTNNNSGTLSVSIVQQISAVKQDSPQTFRTELTVTRNNNNNTGGTGYPSTPATSATQSAKNNEPRVECKLEPTEDTQCSESSSSSHASLQELGLEGLEDIQPDELQNILDTWDRHPEDDLISVLDKLTENDPVDSLGVDSKDREFGNIPMEAFAELPCKQSTVFDEINAQGNLNTGVYSNNTGHPLNEMGAPGVQNTPPYRQPTPQPPVVHTPGPTMNSMAPSPLLGDTGPASETLKQMASKHQNQGYASEPSPTAVVNPGVPQYPNQAYNTMPGAASDSVYPYGQQNARTPMQMSHQGPVDAKGMHGGAYGNTKALTHYNASPDAASASSLQQLQNQIHSHFGPEQGQPRVSQAQPLQITQTQHMQVSHGNQHMQLSQTQQMHINGRPGQQISLAQQQTFSVAQENALPQQQEGSNYINESRKMQLMQQQAKARQGEQGQVMDSQVPPGYVSRPPPEYQQRGYPPSNIGASPLQTMQNMVNQTSTPITHDSLAPGAKAEYSRIQHHRAPHMQGQVPQPNGAVHHGMANYQANSRFPAYPQGEQMTNPNIYQGVPTPSRPKSNNSNFKSAIMRGQRPPNVNVGPEGLNISHPGPPAAMEWQRHMMSPRPQVAMQGAMPSQMPGQMEQMARGNMHPAAMGQFYASQGGMAMGQGVNHGMQMTQQQAMHMQQQQTMGNHQMNNMSAGNRSAMMMMQQQRMQMQAAQQPMSTGIAMAQSAAGMASMPGQHPQQPQTNAPNGNYPMNPGANPNFPMEYIDNPQTSGPDLFDSMVQNPGSADFNLIDEILK